MDDPTDRYYSANASALANLYEHPSNGVDNLFALAFAEGARVLDIGAGSGRDLARLLEIGYDAYGVEPNDEFRRESVTRHPALAGRIGAGGLPNLGQPFGGQFDGVLCSAVLMHLPSQEMFDAAYAMRAVLKQNGRLLLSIPLGRPGLDAEHRDEHGRLFTAIPPERVQLLYERLGFQLIGRWDSDDGLGRPGYTWCSLLFRLAIGEALRAIDQIEGILSRDRKTATYKLALFRALSDIAITEFEQARWLDDGTVAVPVDIVSEKWLYYYWPLFASLTFIPQLRGETESALKRIAFREPLKRLVGLYQGAGGLSRFAIDHKAGALAGEARGQLDAVMAKIANAIVAGPVVFAGGALETGRMFRFNRHTRQIVMSAAIWRELSLLGHWIRDAVIIRWAELTSEISKGQLRASEVVDLLLTEPTTERDVADVRGVYASIEGKECAWSGKPIRGTFRVDHILPFSLWHNNDLWNLVPVLPAVNAAKSDRLPSRDLLLRRGDRIVGYWETLRARRKARFDFEVSRLIGQPYLPTDWQEVTFKCVAEAVEITAMQRGCGRWQPRP